MPKFLVRASYSQAGIEGMMSEGGTSRHAAVKELIESVGGKVHSYDFAFGTYYVVVVCEMPDNASVVAMAAILYLVAGLTFRAPLRDASN